MRKKERTKKESAANHDRQNQLWTYVFLALIVFLFVLIRIRLLDFPLERDEGEYAYSAQLLLRGIDPYHLCYTMKLPGTAAAYAFFFLVFPQTPAGVHWGLLLVNSVTTIALYFLAARFFGRGGGLVASACFALLSIEPTVIGFAGHATQFVVAAAVSGTLVLLKAIESGRLRTFFWSGFLFGLAFLMKQPGIFFFFFAFLYLAYRRWKPMLQWKRFAAEAVVLCLAASFPIALTILAVTAAGDAEKFWFWVYTYAKNYGSIVALGDIPKAFWDNFSDVLKSSPLIWLTCLGGFIALMWDRRVHKDAFFLGGFAIFSFLAVCPGFYFRPHYFVLLLPAVSLLCALAVHSGAPLLQQLQPSRSWELAVPVSFVLAFVFSIIQQGKFFFVEDPVAACQRIYLHQPFVEAMKVSEFIRSHSTENDRIAVVGSEPEIYFYTGRLSATGYVYTYPLMEPQPLAPAMQKEMISEIGAARPRFIVLVDHQSSWLNYRLEEGADQTILHWTETYVHNDYRLRGIVDMLPRGTEYHWEDASTYRPRSTAKILVFEREM